MEKDKVLEGYEKIAFGSIADSVRLLFCEDISYRALKNLDLFSVSEIKRAKGGAMEIKFFDRLKALECMENYSMTNSLNPNFYKALLDGAKALGGDEE